MIDKRELKRLNKKIGKYLDPLALFLLFAVFILPALTVLNLSPQSKSNFNVLGTTSKEEISLVLVGGVHDIFKEERILFPNDKYTKYESTIIKHEKGEYSKPILQIKNTFSDNVNIYVSGGTQNPINAELSLIYEGNEYLLQDRAGNMKEVELNVKENSKNIIYLKLVSPISLKFNEKVEINFVQK